MPVRVNQLTDNQRRLSMQDQPVAIVGGGSIGVGFAIVFARAGARVAVYDASPERRAAIPAEIAARLGDLHDHELLDEPAAAIAARVAVHAELALALDGARLVQECAPEWLDLKIALFAELDALAHPEAILASASSALVVSSFAEALPGRARCLIAHPGNPPYLIPVIEIVPAAFTDPAVVDRALARYEAAGMSVIRVDREIEGFVFNRLQGAVLREAWCLVRDGVSSVEAIDCVMRDGLGLRWSVIGPFETSDLNTRGGIAAHAHRMGPAYARMGASRGQHDPWTPELVSKVEAQRRAVLPLDHWEEAVRARDLKLMRMMRARRTG
ncbi:3-hydroxyacyl-CoA dehydrogenase [Burkholderia gladioli]|uniref:3-hydroxyacyl-CoA dehydrogenase n=1 Tax=Burkholderia gladioli TaxID=28095 RepID=UPI001ABB7AD4